ncbi:glycosyltransferase family 4 protein [Algisphaera agarilytica]|uniref:Glycosyltransferase involved in cell wall biosynthesis n=1 Tax=Algisphaera agarilytica TaxID=1385975 RepID=A0A7X0LM94_9BACT|nr:glycosyltransferase family 4 protein [Algisphaera agarilytica]MBB6430788.1 glycosyltransferase involved in cell wall biosynthesis [Algisphaera agarilytica]
MTTSSPTRVVIIQPSLAKYRVPVYRLLAKQPGIDLKVVYGQDPGIPNVEPDGFEGSFEPHAHVGIGKRRPFVWQPAQLKYADPKHADVLITVWNSRWLSLPLAARKARKNGVRTVVWGHGYSKNESPRRAKLRRRVGLMADGILFYSKTVADRYIADGVDPDNVFVAPNCLDQEPIQAARQAWQSDPARLDTFRQEQGLPDDADTMLYVSRFDPANRVDLLLHAIASLSESRPNLRAHLIGKVNDEATRLQQLAKELGIADRVIFPGAIYGEDDIAPWFLTAKVFCYPSNIGLSVHHAMGYGLPVITGDNADIQNPEFEAIADGVNGKTFADQSAEGLAQALDEVLQDPAQLEALSRNALSTARNDYNLPNMVSGITRAIHGQ